MERSWHDQSPHVNQALYNPEWIYGMMSPTAPLKNRQVCFVDAKWNEEEMLGGDFC